MNDEQHPLTDTQYDIIGQDNDYGKFDDDITIDIPEVKDLDTIITLSLEAYKQQMETLSLIDPSKRQFFLETANKFLKEAKDAIYKRDYLKLQLEKERNKKAGKKSTSGQQTEGVSLENLEEPRTYTRAQLYEMNQAKEKPA